MKCWIFSLLAKNALYSPSALTFNFNTHPIGHDDVTDVTEIFVSEYKSDIAFDVRKKFLQTWVLVQVTSDGLSNGGVFTCECVCVCVHVEMVIISTVKRENIS